MALGFFRHGATAALALVVAGLVIAWGVGAVALWWPEIALGAILFYFSEYGIHRFAFHAPPSRFPFVKKLQHRLHYDHHVEPDRLDLLFLPVWFLVPTLAVTALGYALVFGWTVIASAIFGVMLAIFHYEWVHYVAHIPYQPRTPIGRWMKQYHLRHHFISEKFWFGVSNPSLDLVGRTFQSSARSAKERDDPQALFLRGAHGSCTGREGENSGDGVERDDSGNGRPARRRRARR